MTLYVLYEHASGYSLFKVVEFEEVGLLQAQVEESVTDVSRFKSIVKLVAFSPFKSGVNALDNMNCVSEGILHDDLRLFLESNLPSSGKKQTLSLGIGDSKMASSISDVFNFEVIHTEPVPEILRGIRTHFHKIIKGLAESSACKAQLGLGHSYSRAKIKFNVHRSDNMIIQSICLLDQLDKDINTFSMRIREWYSYHFPELIKIIPDNYTYAKVTRIIKNRKEITDEIKEELEQEIGDDAKVKAILDASKSSMGMDISVIDLINIERFADRVIALADYRKKLQEYLHGKMSLVAPNLNALIGEQVGARLISQAGSLTSLAKYPASTVQILGAEKALFRALKTRSNTPKYGIIFHSTFIGRAKAKNKGRISRYLANKCSIASRIDCFSDIATDVFGNHLRDQVESRLKFYESGEIPRKNIDVMKEAIEEAATVAAKQAKKLKKKQKKNKSMDCGPCENYESNQSIIESENLESEFNTSTSKKKKKRKSKGGSEVEQELEPTSPPPKKKKKKKSCPDSD